MNQNECESDEDCEVYFLKPVNEYNIVEKIKEANEELFSTPQPLSPSLTGPQRRVQFRQNLEDFEPHANDNNSQLLNSQTDNSNNANDTTKLIENEELDTSLNNCQPLPSIAAESESDLDEICEDIEELSLIPNELITDQSHIDLKQCERNNLNDNIGESETGNSSPEPLTDDTKYDDDYENDDEIVNDNENDGDDDDDEDDDDDMSIIAAIYLPENINMNDLDSSMMDKNSSEIKKPAKRRFSFRMKKFNSKKTTSPHKNDIKFNYKTCCEYRNSEFDKLPRYTGYLSEYGLTQKQWESREKRMQHCRKIVLEKNLKARESEIQKMNDNERAFTRWLKNKMRFPINKTRNMFDFKTQSTIFNRK